LPLDVLYRRLADINDMLREERDFRPEAEIGTVCRLDGSGLIVEDAHIALANPLSDEDPHPLALNLDAAVLVLALDLKDEPGGLAAPEALPLLKRRDPERVRMLAVRSLGRAQLPEVSLEARQSHEDDTG
jgi:hypothetical protein